MVLALPELPLRVRWLGAALDAPVARNAPVLSGLCDQALAGDVRAREALLPLALCLAGLVAWDGPGESPVRRALRVEAESLALWPLVRLLNCGPPSGDEPPPAETTVPDYGAGRELTVGERRSLARRPTRAQLDRLLFDPHPLVLHQLLQCPKLTEADVLRLTSRRPPRRVALAAVTQNVRWLARSRVRMALVLQPSCPLGVSIPLLHTVVRRDLDAVVRDPALPALLRSTARELLSLAPPWGAPSSALQ